jgi:hypothetical protein
MSIYFFMKNTTVRETIHFDGMQLTLRELKNQIISLKNFTGDDAYANLHVETKAGRGVCARACVRACVCAHACVAACLAFTRSSSVACLTASVTCACARLFTTCMLSACNACRRQRTTKTTS